MARSSRVSAGRLVARGGLAALALAAAGYLAGGSPTARRPDSAPVEQAAPTSPNPVPAEVAPERARQLARLGVPRAHAQGCRGQGVTVAVLDSGFRGYRSFLGRGLPASVRAKSFRADGNLEARDSQH